MEDQGYQGIVLIWDMGDLSTAKLVCLSDSSFGNLWDGESQGSYIIFLEGQNGNCSPLMWQSKKLCRVVRSTMAAETLSQIKAVTSCSTHKTEQQETDG